MQHEFLRQLETSKLSEQCVAAMPLFYDHFQTPADFERFEGFVIQRRWMGGTLESFVDRAISWISHLMRAFYRNRMAYRMEDDAELENRGSKPRFVLKARPRSEAEIHAEIHAEIRGELEASGRCCSVKSFWTSVIELLILLPRVAKASTPIKSALSLHPCL